MAVTLANEARCEEFRAQYLRFAYLWTTDLSASLASFLQDEGAVLPGGGKDDPPLAKFEERIAKYK